MSRCAFSAFSHMLCGLAVCAAATGMAGEPTDSWKVGDDLLTLRLTRSTDGGISETCSVRGMDMPYQGAPGAVLIEGREWQELHAAAASETGGSVHLRGETAGIAWRLTYERTGPGLVTKSLVLESRTDVLLQRVAPAVFTADPVPAIVSTQLQDIAAFVRNGSNGIFLSLDFPYSRITTEDCVVRVAYPAFEALRAGHAYACHSLTIGATQLSGELRYGRDTGEAAAMDAYVQTRHSPRFEKPLLVSACINNRYTMPRDGMVWYTYKDHPTLSLNLDLMKRELDLMQQMGIEYYQVFPGVFDWAPGDPEPGAVHDVVAYGSARGIRIGDYSGCNSVFCPHYNEHGNALAHPEWQMRDAGQHAGAFCFGCPAFVEYYIKTVVPAAREFGFKLHCLDFLGITSCFADHGHPPGDDSVYHQVAGLMRFMKTLADVDPEMMVWSNSGNWSEFLPKIAWSNPNLYLTDPFIATPWPGLNMTRLLDDARREQMVSLHYTHYIPYRNFTNCQYFFSQNSIVPDIRNYQYGTLSSIAVTPNLCLAEVRPWLDRLPASQQQEVTAFYQRWTRFLKDNYPLWRQTHHVGDNPAPGGIEIFGHADGSHGFVFVVNGNYWSDVVSIPLDERLGFSAHGCCEIVELHPTQRLVLAPEGPTPAYGTTITLDAPAQQVRVFEVRPATESIDAPRVYGIPGVLEQTPHGYLLKTSAPQGTTHRFAVCVPANATPVSSASVRSDIPRQAKRLFAATELALLGGGDQYTLFDVTFRRTAAATELRHWNVQPGNADMGLSQNWPKGLLPTPTQKKFPLFAAARNSEVSSESAAVRSRELGALANFMGAYIDNAFSEEQETWIDLKTDGGEPLAVVTIAAAAPQRDVAVPSMAQDGETSWWLQTSFHLPFMYTIGAESAFDEHAVLVFPLLAPTRVRDLRAWVNGEPLEVRRYAYPRNRSLSTWWADLVGTSARGGDNVLVVYVDFREQ